MASVGSVEVPVLLVLMCKAEVGLHIWEGQHGLVEGPCNCGQVVARG
jgi:hypothetical protein